MEDNNSIPYPKKRRKKPNIEKDHRDPLYYNAAKDKDSLPIPNGLPAVPKINQYDAEAVMEDLTRVSPHGFQIPPLVNPDNGNFMAPKAKQPSYEQCAMLGRLVAMGLPLESACTLLSPPLHYHKVVYALEHNRRKAIIYRRSQSEWLYQSIQLLLTRPPSEIAGLIFILKNRHGKLFDGNRRMQIDVNSNNTPLQLTSPEVIARAREYALEESTSSNSTEVIDVEEVKEEEKEPKKELIAPTSSSLSIVDNANLNSGNDISSSLSSSYQSIPKVKALKPYEKSEEDLAKEYMDELMGGGTE